MEVNDWVTHKVFGWSGQFRHYLVEEEIITGRKTTFCVVEDDKGNIYIGKEENLATYDVSLSVDI